jgi:heme oxygenase (biliverdin-IX-beta and delta-forming)
MSTNANNLHGVLREATRALHEDLERAVDIDEEISSRARYAAYLARLWRVHSAAEKALAHIDFAPAGFDYSRRQRSRFLENDLYDLGIATNELSRISPVPFPWLESVEAGLGCVYVVEGSALGARAILPQIELRLGLTPDCGASYFVGFGEEGKPLWRACLNALNAIDPHSPTAVGVLDAAAATFAMFRQWLPARPAEATSPVVA